MRTRIEATNLRPGLFALACCLACALGALSAPARADDGDGGGHVQAVSGDTLRVDAAALSNLSLSAAAVEGFPDVLGVLGAISPVENQVTSVPARVAGRIDSVFKVSGEYVRAGDALALEYSPDYVEARQEYLEALKKDAGLAARGATDPPHDRDFFDLAAISREKLRNMGLDDRDIAALPSNPNNGDLVVRATRSGAITAVNTAVGDMQNQGDTLMVVSNLDKVWFDGDLYAEDLSKVRPGQRITLETDGLSSPLTGRISFISPVIDPGAHTIKIRALVDNPNRVLRSGMVVEGDITVSEKKALVVPLTALLNLHGSWWCYKRTGPGLFTRVPVQEGDEAGGLATVTAGLAPGDVVVSGGNLVLDAIFSAN